MVVPHVTTNASHLIGPLYIDVFYSLCLYFSFYFFLVVVVAVVEKVEAANETSMKKQVTHCNWSVPRYLVSRIVSNVFGFFFYVQ